MTKIYYIQSLTGEIRYVGKTNRDINKRLKEHLKETKTYKGKWIQQLGGGVEIKLLDTVPEEESNFWETYWISQLRSWGFRLTNLTVGGDGGKGFKHSEETKKIIGEFSKGVVFSEVRKRKISESKRGKKFPKISKSKIGVKHSEETKKKISDSTKGRIISIETREKISKSKKGKNTYKMTDDIRFKISETLKKGKPSKKSLEALKKYNKHRKTLGEWHSEETKKKISESNKGHKVTDETKKKISESCTKYSLKFFNKKLKPLLTKGLSKKEISLKLKIPYGSTCYLIKKYL